MTYNRFSSLLVSRRSLFPLRSMEAIRAGPLLKSCGFTDDQVNAEASKWTTTAEAIISSLKFEEASLTEAQRIRVYHYYLPIVMWIRRVKEAHQGTAPMMLGISAPQGCGKSTLVGCLLDVFDQLNMKAACVSIDDFYLKHSDQNAVAKSKSENPLLQCRGNAMTHDVQLGKDILKQLKGLGGEGEVRIPRYDKSAFGGKGDRMDASEWNTVQGPLDIVLFEGWMLGFTAQSPEAVEKVSPHLLPINEALKEYNADWDTFVDAWFVIKVGDPDWVRKWRLEAEHAMKRSGKSGMSDEAVQAFVDCYMPAYKAYLPTLYSEGPSTSIPGKCLIIEVDEHRAPIQHQPNQLL